MNDRELARALSYDGKQLKTIGGITNALVAWDRDFTLELGVTRQGTTQLCLVISINGVKANYNDELLNRSSRQKPKA
ncbi:hypothetical protein A3742_00780 [Oleiphilus sp. HI0071]|jgi:hypothetical protein|uniref:hypothetical protein n=1 Tax=unclassified Oleiphilus TaxID=2631174 RepID=UPI0007C336B5|nr:MULTISPECIES: hypothetical protein [unclassified Oleiphilus]KZY71058.1 hypothetical protein A3737_11945 [Oleiphilus sp. HI0065]KZY82991.1 hypothetical protein A3742_00780 [Oleiphilus sp. HI0071]KZZ03695.1 hypothetical protein A3744_10240 [Oleiphilus sp. HI0073]KZZ49985.1 hypothetical protein A3760_20930 [Oleiphilus sp. HI0122]KZZ70851.1 hypothetical protein A3765_02750 [Oleiphilus sp. HI0130]KZZ82269.1 hypothetical protein A3767_04410 [Oleiphilus sp. HI0133]